ncbi:hypothetical protein COCMIDRAFT_97339 [Bipolaris oryzae ATCC 44560]|uniref:RING-type domain-containing protein n=1 Tax=Bipolaris oryzae ATCC 44560 TaxID=930090 RepID=W6YZP6_COCMI|nr:uncharacterized protein COCMIDRAFT_97339 [Bipolaris oryzae ATCC 44560]EUC44807.1 hypothetical protein COCMIDRAFT_97339 [Bipolaris oryzae ATCC 44560]
MSHQSNEYSSQVRHAWVNEQAAYQRVRLRMRILEDVCRLAQEDNRLENVLCIAPDILRRLEKHRFPYPPRLEDLDDAQVVEEATAARKWLSAVLDCHIKAMPREQEMLTIKLAVGKQYKGQQGDWTERERLYMALTDYSLPSSESRLQAGFMVALHRNLAEHLQDIVKLGAVYTERLQRLSDEAADLLDTLARIADKAESIVVDHFACAIPLAQLATTTNDTRVIGDDTAACCPICQNPYTALSEFPIHELLDDYPVRIKHCGHVVGKACLEQWMMTPKIEEAKYPHRTCPLCRVKVEGVKPPETPRALKKHFQDDRRAMEALHELIYGFGVEVEDCMSAVAKCMSEEIACTELLTVVARSGSNEEQCEVLKEEVKELQKEKRAWGFRGEGVWSRLRDEWMKSGVVRGA